MPNIRYQREAELMVLMMARGKANAINATMMDELYEAVQSAAADTAIRGLVLASGCPRFFSSGFDVREVFQYNRAEMCTFFTRFTGLYEGLRGFPKPVVGALGGHTFAGGSILALACDIRVMAQGEFGFAVNEIDLGLVLTAEIERMLVDAVGTGRARELLLSGEPITPEEAYRIGLVNEIAPPDAVLPRAIARARVLASKPPIAFERMKRNLRGQPSATGPAEIERFLDIWFGQEATDARRRVAEKLGSSSGER